jgi:hypothetical protein
MRHFLLFIAVFAIVFSCTYQNEEEKYYQQQNTSNQSNSLDSGLLAHFCFEQSLADSSVHNVAGLFSGNPVYEPNVAFGTSNYALWLNGQDNWFEIPIGKHDTIAISMFFKGDAALSPTMKPCLLDYGNDALELNLDAVTSGTYIVINGDKLDNPPENWISSFSEWNHLYVEAILSQKQVTIIYDSNSKPNIVMNPNITSPLVFSGESVIIGKEYSDTLKESYFKGLIDEIRIYNRKLSDAELYEITKVLHD